MSRLHLRRLLVAGAAAALAIVVPGGARAASAADDDAAYQRGYDLGLEAYRYGLPLLTTERTFRNQTSVNVSNGHGFGPVNRFNPIRQFATPEDRSVVAPNFDTLYSIAWLDLRHQPQVIHVPKVSDRYFVIPLMTPYTEDFANLGSVRRTPPGDYAVVGPHDRHRRLPDGVTRIASPYDRVWVIERVYADNGNRRDIRQVHRIQDQITTVPLSRYGDRGWTPEPPRHPDTTVDDPGLPTGLAFYDRLGTLLDRFPPPAADRPELDRLAEIGVGPGQHPSSDPAIDPDVLAGMEAAVADGPATVRADAQASYAATFGTYNGYLVTRTGGYGQDYRLRAMVTQVGLGALKPDQSIYPLALADRTGAALTGAKKYVVHIAAGGLPPVTADGFWSLTLYDNDGFLVPNAAHRYVINDRSDLHVNPDGSIDLYIQATPPTDPDRAQNWLPAPEGGFRLIWRLYATRPDAIPGVLDGSGWTAPAIVPAP
jgi:hypothetical protein